MEVAFGDDVCATVISENVAVAKAPAHQREVFSYAEYQPQCAGLRGAV